MRERRRDAIFVSHFDLVSWGVGGVGEWEGEGWRAKDGGLGGDGWIFVPLSLSTKVDAYSGEVKMRSV